MLIHSKSELKAALLPKIRESIKQTQEQIYEVINKCLLQFYHEYTPEQYYRTQQLLNSLIKSEIIELSNGYKAKVYFDLTAMNYTMKKIKSSKYSSSGRIHSNDWDGAREMEFGGVKGLHGYRGTGHSTPITGTKFWLDSKTKIDGKVIGMLITELKSKGIPIKQ